MSCCSLEGLEREFGSRTAAWDLRRYRWRGPLRSSRLLIEGLAAQGTAGSTLLDVGGGVGAVTHALLEAGAESAMLVDASSAYLRAAREEAERQGHGERIVAHHGDAVDILPRLPPADIVTLDRVICCDPDLHGLLGAAIGRARRMVGLVYPRERWWVRAVLGAGNLTYRLRRCDFRVYLHSARAVEGLLARRGFDRTSHSKTFLWQVQVYARRQTNDGRKTKDEGRSLAGQGPVQRIDFS